MGLQPLGCLGCDCPCTACCRLYFRLKDGVLTHYQNSYIPTLSSLPPPPPPSTPKLLAKPQLEISIFMVYSQSFWDIYKKFKIVSMACGSVFTKFCMQGPIFWNLLKELFFIPPPLQTIEPDLLSFICFGCECAGKACCKLSFLTLFSGVVFYHFFTCHPKDTSLWMCLQGLLQGISDWKTVSCPNFE